MKKMIKYIHLSSGNGPAECCWVVAQTMKVFLKYCKQSNIDTAIIRRNEGPQTGTLSSVLIEVKGIALLNKLQDWIGTIQWKGQSPFRKHHKRKNWFISIEVYDRVVDSGFHISDLEYQTFRASGPGGQHRNKVETAVRVTHPPSGLTATASDSRSQLANKESAIKKLQALMKAADVKNANRLRNDQWQQHTSLKRGEAVKVFEGSRFKEQ